ncbi:MAG: cytochrome c [Ignavibacteriales bacterium]|nr:cytochrome c [Ignavibacteriales bacterium]
MKKGWVILNGSLLILLLVVIGMIVFVQRDFTHRNLDFMPGMVSSIAYKPQAPWQEGDVGPPLVPGTVVRGFEPFEYKPTPEDALRAGRELTSPVADTNIAALERGAAVYAAMCQPCHGPTGLGDGVITKRGFPPPPSLFADNALNMKDGQMYHIVTFGQRNMPSLASQVSRSDRWNVLAYIRSWQSKQQQKGSRR